MEMENVALKSFGLLSVVTIPLGVRPMGKVWQLLRGRAFSEAPLQAVVPQRRMKYTWGSYSGTKDFFFLCVCVTVEQKVYPTFYFLAF